VNVARPSAILPEPPGELKRLSGRLLDRVLAEIDAHGPMPFSRYMEMALYEPGLGYYSAGLARFGAEGDFVTAPELGGVFAQCLARQVAEAVEPLGDYAILEVGAGSGALAAGLLERLDDTRPPARYLVLERSASLRQAQRDTLAARSPGWRDRVEWLDRPPERPWEGVLIANEVMDALPVEIFETASGKVFQVTVEAAQGALAWGRREAPEGLERAVRAALGGSLDGYVGVYRSEICPMLGPWLEGLTETMRRGCALLADYGYPRREYYAPERHMGTLVCHYRHRAHGDPLWWPGLQDISAFVDFTAVAEAAGRCGLDVAGYTSQAMFLLGCGLEEVLSRLAGLPDRERLALAAEVRRLTLPGEMGERFQVIALTRGLELEPRGFRTLDLRRRL